MKVPCFLATCLKLSLLFLGVACRPATEAESQLPASGEIYILNQLPAGVSCQWLETATLTDGSGCGILDASVAPSSTERLRFNLRKRASRMQANFVLAHEFLPGESREGCASNQASVRFSLYRCHFRQPAAFAE